MKSAEKWANEIAPGAKIKFDLGNGQTVRFPGLGASVLEHASVLAILRAAQRDAIEAALAALPANVPSNTEWIAAFDDGINACRDAIRSLLPSDP